MRCLIRSAMVIISRPCFRANFVSSGTRAIVPSSFMISQITPTGAKPALRAQCVVANEQRNLQLVESFGGHRQANQPAAEPREEVDGFRRDFFGRDRQI